MRVIPLELVNDYYYHLDTCFCPLAPGVAIYYPRAFDDYAQLVLKEQVPKLIAVDEAEAQRFACNAVVVGRTVVTNTGCPQAARRPAGPRLHAARDLPRRVRQSRRQRQVPHAAARRRRSRRLAFVVRSPAFRRQVRSPAFGRQVRSPAFGRLSALYSA